MADRAGNRPHRRLRGALIFLGALLLVFAGFLGGWWYRANNPSTTNYSSASLTSRTPSTGVTESAGQAIANLEEVQDILDAEAYTQPDADAAGTAIVQALLQTTGDPYARYFTNGQYQDYLAKNTDQYAGIGVVLAERAGTVYVARVIAGGPADVAGIREGDFIIDIDGQTRTNWTLEDATSLIKRGAGESVTLGWRRPETPFGAGGETFSATISCAVIDTPNVTSSLVDGSVGYISVTQFNNRASDDVAAAISSLEAQGATGYLLDLRGNPGGYLMQAVDMTSLFLGQGTVVQVQSRTSGVTAKTVDADRHLTDRPVVVLVNQDSASASEIVAAALQQNARGTVIGTTTFGKGAAQGIRSLASGGAIKYTVAYYLTPDGTAIEGTGITPDQTVAMSADLRGTADDVQYAAGLQALAALVAQTAR